MNRISPLIVLLILISSVCFAQNSDTIVTIKFAAINSKVNADFPVYVIISSNKGKFIDVGALGMKIAYNYKNLTYKKLEKISPAFLKAGSKPLYNPIDSMFNFVFTSAGTAPARFIQNDTVITLIFNNKSKPNDKFVSNLNFKKGSMCSSLGGFNYNPVFINGVIKNYK